MSVYTKTILCNMALSHLGVGKELSDADTDTSEYASACRMFYEHAIREVLRSWRWPFATKQADLFLLETSPTTEWGYSYMYPAEALRIRRILGGARPGVETNDTRVAYRVVQGNATADRDGIIKSTTPSGSGNISMDGGYTSSGLYTATEGRLITIYSAGNVSSRTFTITGTNRDGAALVEAVTGPNATTVTSAGYFMTISSISISGAAAAAIEVGASSSYGKEIYTDQSSAVVEYTVYVSSESRFDHDFGIAVSYLLASYIAPRITVGDNFSLAKSSFDLYNLTMSKVKANAADEDQLDPYPESVFIRARA